MSQNLALVPHPARHPCCWRPLPGVRLLQPDCAHPGCHAPPPPAPPSSAKHSTDFNAKLWQSKPHAFVSSPAEAAIARDTTDALTGSIITYLTVRDGASLLRLQLIYYSLASCVRVIPQQTVHHAHDSRLHRPLNRRLSSGALQAATSDMHWVSTCTGCKKMSNTCLTIHSQHTRLVTLPAFSRTRTIRMLPQ